jgi:putative ABC transport system permease protein
VQIQPVGRLAVHSAARDSTVTAALRARPGTLRDVAIYGEAVKVPGTAADVTAQAFDGDAAWLDYAMIAGRWYNAAGEVDVNTTFLTASGLAVGDTTTVETVGTGTARITVRIVGEVFDPSNNPLLFASTQTLPGFATRQNLQGYDVGLRPGTSTGAYMQAVNKALGSDSPWVAAPPQASSAFGIATKLMSLLALMAAVAAGLGVLNTVLMSTRDRVHDLGIFKAIGMRPGQILTMVICQVAAPAVVAAAIAAPIAIALTTGTVRAMAGAAHSGVPASFSQVFPPSRLALLSLGALAIALVGALLPASWAARARPAAALRAE